MFVYLRGAWFDSEVEAMPRIVPKVLLWSKQVRIFHVINEKPEPWKMLWVCALRWTYKMLSLPDAPWLSGLNLGEQYNEIIIRKEAKSTPSIKNETIGQHMQPHLSSLVLIQNS